MNIPLAGAFVGTAVALSLLAAEYFIARASAGERSRGGHRTYVLNATERKHIATIARFCIFVPPAFAAAAWLVRG